MRCSAKANAPSPSRKDTRLVSSGAGLRGMKLTAVMQNCVRWVLLNGVQLVAEAYE